MVRRVTNFCPASLIRSAGFLFGGACCAEYFSPGHSDVRKGITDLRTPVACPVCVADFASIFRKILLDKNADAWRDFEPPNPIDMENVA